jgi:hypothetical protein
MSGLLRRIKRSRTADAGEAPTEGQAAAPDGAPTTAETSGGEASTARTTELPATAPAVQADPHAPAGLDAAEAAAAPTGRRGRLRRRLRYLRRARELMLRDLGGLLYEVHRTGGGDVAGHSGVIGPKVDRLASLDAEAAAIEAALGSPRSEDVVFQPGVGGTCDFCGELYGSAARFCSNCGSPTGSAVRATPAPLVGKRPVPPMPMPPAEPVEKKAEEPVEKADEPVEKAEGSVAESAEPDEPAAEKTDEPAAKADKPAAEPDEPSTARDEPEPRGGDAAPGGARSPFAGLSNGRSEDGKPPELSPGDPLATRESRK